MAFVIAMCVIETEYAPFVGTEPMWQEEGEIVSNPESANEYEAGGFIV